MSAGSMWRGGLGLFWFGLMASMGAVAELWAPSIGVVGMVCFVAGISLMLFSRI